MKFRTKSTLVSSALLAALGAMSNLSAVPLPFTVDGLDVTVSGTVNGSYNSNVLSSPGGATKFDDYILTITPGVKFEYGKNADTDIVLNYTESFLRYLQHTSLNEELSSVSLSVDRKQGQLELTANAAYVQNYNNTPSAVSPTLSSIIRYDTITAGANANYNLSDKFNFGGGLQFAQNHYLYTVGQNYQDTDTYTIPLDAYYVYTNEISVGLTYTYSQTDPKPSANGTPAQWRENNAADVSVKFNQWEKVTGTVNVGVTQNYVAALPGGSSTTSDTIGYGIDLQYAYTEKLAFTLNGNRGFSTGSAGQNIENTSVGLGVNYMLTDTVSLQANLLTYTVSDYLGQVPSRTDDNYTSGISVNWSPTTYLTLSAGYTYFMNSSNFPGATYNINVVSISGTIHY